MQAPALVREPPTPHATLTGFATGKQPATAHACERLKFANKHATLTAWFAEHVLIAAEIAFVLPPATPNRHDATAKPGTTLTTVEAIESPAVAQSAAVPRDVSSFEPSEIGAPPEQAMDVALIATRASEERVRRILMFAFPFKRSLHSFPFSTPRAIDGRI
jgi:hypothetical protein